VTVADIRIEVHDITAVEALVIFLLCVAIGVLIGRAR
jgi:hypothetical protein